MTFRGWVAEHLVLHTCRFIKGYGFDTIIHLPEFFTVNDAIYHSFLFASLARRDEITYIIADTNFMTSSHTKGAPVITSALISSLTIFGKPVFLEAALERYPHAPTVKDGITFALSAGATGVGLTNWLPFVSAAHLPAYLPSSMVPCEHAVSTAVLAPKHTFLGLRGLQNMPQDPFHDLFVSFAEDHNSCKDRYHVYVDVLMFIAHEYKYSRIYAVRPLLCAANMIAPLDATLSRLKREGRFAGFLTIGIIPSPNETVVPIPQLLV